MSTTTTPKTILFLGASGGCGFSTLRRSLEAGHTCIALCRTPSKLSAKLPAELLTKLKLEQGNAHDVAAVARCLVNPSNPGRVVDMVISSIGGAFSMKTGIDDAHVCEKGAKALLEALALVRKNGATGSPRIVGVSSTGITESGRDIPVLMIPLYKGLLAVPHKDKKMLEDLLVESGEQWTIVRPAFLTDGPAVGKVRAGMEDLTAHKVEKKEIGYTISREDVGKWMFENLVEERDAKWVRKAASITY
ncbi:NAD(P)-binding protein [Coniochaeta ligniaria NRRL 30616]|uniref:NAD(P)-binding protein n=1 Tax=Coniochaeta ligniaria NRRL 30616 TaxID=1408157 RepID=A0A1J7J319_9PEZI|nr:NAD(P)-binding protein [Coniochaeta ligniaria NRRL 30616]